VARVYLIIGLAILFAGAAFAQAVITVPLEPPATDQAATDEGAAEEPSAEEYDPSAPPIPEEAMGPEEASPADENTPATDVTTHTSSDEEPLSDEELMDRFMQPIEEPGDIYNAATDGPENLPAPIPDEEGVSRVAVIRGLDKITARVTNIDAPVGVPVMFNSLEILVQTCDKRPPEETPETTAFIQVTEHRLDGTLERIFSGWMYASSPSLNPLEHSTYDIWVIDCKTL